MFQGYSEVSHSIDVPANNDGEEGGCTSSDCQSNQSESSNDSKGRLSFLETELQARTRDLDRLKFKIDKMKSHQISSPVTSRRETKPINVKIEVERLRKDKKVMAELLKQSQQELTRKDSINKKLKMENDKISRNMIALQGKLAENGRTQNLLEELNRVRSELSVLTNKTDRLAPTYQGQSPDKDGKGRYIEELVIEKEQLKQCLSAIYFKITPYAVSLPSRSATPPVWTEDVKNSFDQFWEEKIKLQRELEELREQIKSRETLAEQNSRTYPECYETSVSECSTTDSKSDYLSDATIIKVPRPTGHHDLESEVCRWKEMYQNVYDKYRSSQHTVAYHEKKFKKIYSILDDLAKRVYDEESFSENVSGYNITKIVQKLSEEYDHLKESVKKVKHEEQFQTDLQKSIIEAEKTLEEKGRNARTLRNAIGTLQLTSNMETKVASLAETMLLIYNNQLNWLKQLEHNNTLPNSEGEETHSNSPNQCELDLPNQDDEKVENRLSGGDAMSCSSESNESSTCDANEDIQKNRISDLNLECTSDSLVQNDKKVELSEENIVGEKEAEVVGEHESGKTDESQEEVKIENAEAVLEEKKEASDAVEDEGGEEKEGNIEKEAGDSGEKENLDNSESVEQVTGTDVQTEDNASEKIQNDVGNENDQEEKKSESNAEEANEKVNETKSDEVSEENKGDQEHETEKDNAEENKGEEDKEEEKEKDSEETKKDDEDGKDEDDNDDDDSKEPQNNSNADGEENTENEKDNTENSSKDKENKEEEPKKNKDTDESDGTKEGEEVENKNEDKTEIDESCEIDENSEITDATEDKENVENNTEKQTEDIEENKNKSVSEQSVEKSEGNAIEETVIQPKSSEDIQSEPEGHTGDGKEVNIVENSEEANETPVCSEEKTNIEDPKNQNSENADVNDEEKIKNQSDESESKSNDGKEECNENQLEQTADDKVDNSAEIENCATEKSESEIESQHESDRISPIPEAEEENKEASGTEEENKEGITEAEEENKEASKLEEETKEDITKTEEGNKEDITEAEEGNKEASKVEEESKEATEVEEENKEASEAEEKNKEDSNQAEENTEASDTNDLTKDNEEANDQSENVTATEEHSELNVPSKSSCADGTTNDSEENLCVSVKSSQADDGEQDASTEASDKQIVINETEQTNTEESPCSSVSQSVNDNKETVKIIINPASSEEHESVNEDTSQVCTNKNQENVDETEDSLNESKSESLVKDEPELAPVIEPEITKVVIEPRNSVFFSNINVLEKDATSERKVHKEASRRSEEESISKRIEELETEMSEMLEVKRHHMKVACDLAEKLEAMKKRESDLQDQLSNAETKTSQEVEVLCKEWSGKEQSYQDEIAAWKENVEQQNSVLQRLKADLDHAQQMAQFKENEIAQLREKQPENLLERETQTSDHEEDPNSKELQETVDRLRITSEHYQQQLMENRTVVREVKSIIEGSVAQLVTLKAMGTKHMKREYVYRNNLAQKELDLKHLQTELDKQSIDARAKVNIIEKQRNEIRSLREDVRKCQKDISAKVEFIDELQSRMQVLISSESRPNSSNPEDLEIYTIGRRCIDEQHAIQLEKQKEELERMRQELHHLELKFSDIDSAAESSDHQNLSHPGSAGSVGSVSEELPMDGNLCLCKRKDVSKILKLSEESYLNLLASLVVCLGIHDIKYNKSLQRLSWSQCKEISAERKANQKKIMKVIQGLKKEERTVSPRIHQPERSRSTGETEKRRNLVKCISPQNGRSMYISDMIRQAEENLDKDKGTKTDGRKPTSWRPHTSLNDRRIPLELKNGEILALLGNADPKSVPKPTLSSK